MHPWSVGDHLTHRFNPGLGTGRVTAIEGRVLVVHFPLAATTLRLAGSNDALAPGAEPARMRDRSPFERLAIGRELQRRTGELDDDETAADRGNAPGAELGIEAVGKVVTHRPGMH